MTADALISRCHALGVTLAPGPAGRLRVSPPGALPEDLREELKQCKAAVLAALHSNPLSLRCPHCNSEARPDGGTASKDGTGYIQFWRCVSCGAKGSMVFRLQ